VDEGRAPGVRHSAAGIWQLALGIVAWLMIGSDSEQP
jgi:hypothetical protein